MPKSRHAAVRAPRTVNEPMATLSQLKELVAQMDKEEVSRRYMQDFLRRRLVGPSDAPTVVPATRDNEWLRAAETTAREHYPHAVTEILELVAPWCDPDLDLEFKPKVADDVHSRQELEKGRELKADVKKALFWLHVQEVTQVVIRMPKPWVPICTREVIGGNPSDEREPDWESIERADMSHHVDLLHADVFRTYKHLDPDFDTGAHIILGISGIGNLLHRAMSTTGAARYGLISDGMWGSMMRSIEDALRKAIVFASKGDQKRAEQLLPFLAQQRSGRPIVCYHEGTAFVLVSPG